MRKSVLVLVVCSLLVGLAAPALAAKPLFASLRAPVKQLIKDENLEPLYFDGDGNLVLRSDTGHEVLMTQAFLLAYGTHQHDDEASVCTNCPCSSPGRIWDLAKDLYTIFCLCREFLDWCGAVWEGWGECRGYGEWFITCDFIAGQIYWR